jgi:hypothetical protein
MLSLYLSSPPKIKSLVAIVHTLNCLEFFFIWIDKNYMIKIKNLVGEKEYCKKRRACQPEQELSNQDKSWVAYFFGHDSSSFFFLVNLEFHSSLFKLVKNDANHIVLSPSNHPRIYASMEYASITIFFIFPNCRCHALTLMHHHTTSFGLLLSFFFLNFFWGFFFSTYFCGYTCAASR